MTYFVSMEPFNPNQTNKQYIYIYAYILLRLVLYNYVLETRDSIKIHESTCF